MDSSVGEKITTFVFQSHGMSCGKMFGFFVHYVELPATRHSFGVREMVELFRSSGHLQTKMLNIDRFQPLSCDNFLVFFVFDCQLDYLVALWKWSF